MFCKLGQKEVPDAGCFTCPKQEVFEFTKEQLADFEKLEVKVCAREVNVITTELDGTLHVRALTVAGRKLRVDDWWGWGD